MRITLAILLLACTAFAGCSQEGIPQFRDPVKDPIEDEPGVFPTPRPSTTAPVPDPENDTTQGPEPPGNGTQGGNGTTNHTALTPVLIVHNTTAEPPVALVTLDAVNPNGTYIRWTLEIVGGLVRSGDSVDRPNEFEYGEPKRWPRNMTLEFPEAGNQTVVITMESDTEFIQLQTVIELGADATFAELCPTDEAAILLPGNVYRASDENLYRESNEHAGLQPAFLSAACPTPDPPYP